MLSTLEPQPTCSRPHYKPSSARHWISSQAATRHQRSMFGLARTASQQTHITIQMTISMLFCTVRRCLSSGCHQEPARFPFTLPFMLATDKSRSAVRMSRARHSRLTQIDVLAENIEPDITVTLRPGHVLYLPAYWYHRVKSKVTSVQCYTRLSSCRAYLSQLISGSRQMRM